MTDAFLQWRAEARMLGYRNARVIDGVLIFTGEPSIESRFFFNVIKVGDGRFNWRRSVVVD